MNWGGFAGGFAQGFGSGVNMVTKFDEIAKKGQIEKVRTQAMTEAKAAHAADVESRIQDNSKSQNPAASMGVTGQPAAEATAQPAAPPAAPQATAPIKPEDEDRPMTRRRVLSEPAAQPEAKPIAAPTQSAPAQPAAIGLPFVVDGKGYATREDARAAAAKLAKSEDHYIRQNVVPRMQQVYIDQGNIEMADAWGKWAEERDNKAVMKEWAGAFRAAQMGNFEKAADHVFELYKRYDDGITPLSKTTVKDDQGNVTGFNVKLKREATGEEYSQFIDKKSLTEMGLSALSPQAMFETQFKRQQAADEAAAKAKAEAVTAQRNLQIDNYKAERDNRYARGLKQVENQYQTERDIRNQQDRVELKTLESQLDAANASSKVRREVGAKVDALRGAGYGEEFINGVLPSLLGVGEYKKAMSPEDAKLKIRGELMSNDRAFQKMTEEQRAAEVGRVMEFVYGKPTTTPRANSQATPPSSPPVWRP